METEEESLDGQLLFMAKRPLPTLTLPKEMGNLLKSQLLGRNGIREHLHPAHELCPRLTLLVAVAEEPGSTGVLVTWTFR